MRATVSGRGDADIIAIVNALAPLPCKTGRSTLAHARRGRSTGRLSPAETKALLQQVANPLTPTTCC